MTTFLKSHPIAAYFLLTFAISWSGVLLAIGASEGMTGVRAQDSPLFPIAVLAMVAGPSVTGVVLTGLLDGKSGLRTLGSRLIKWRVGAQWCAIALLATPALSIAATIALSFFAPDVHPAVSNADDKAALVRLGLVVGATAGFFEELGWTGFAIPRLKQHRGVLATGLFVGVLWSAWHVLVVAWGIGERAGTIPLPLFMIVDGLATLPAFRVLMVLVYDRTDSVFAAMLMHASLTACTLILTPQITGALLLAHVVVFASLVWLLIVAVGIGGDRWPTRRPSPPAALV